MPLASASLRLPICATPFLLHTLFSYAMSLKRTAFYAQNLCMVQKLLQCPKYCVPSCENTPAPKGGRGGLRRGQAAGKQSFDAMSYGS